MTLHRSAACMLICLLASTFGVAVDVPAGEYAKHFGALAKLSVAVAEAMPADQ